MTYMDCMTSSPDIPQKKPNRLRPAFTATVSAPLLGRLDALAKERGWTRSETLEEVLGTYFSGPSGSV